MQDEISTYLLIAIIVLSAFSIGYGILETQLSTYGNLCDSTGRNESICPANCTVEFYN